MKKEMVVKFNKKQVKALAFIRARAEQYFDELHAQKPYLYKMEDRNHTVDMFMLGILDSIVELGTFTIEE